MRFFIGILLLAGMISCSNEDNNNVVEEKINITGSWKPYKYEFRGKTIMVSNCQQQGLIQINTDLSGVYERYDVSTTGNCNKFDSFVGNWSYDNLYSSLTITYTEANVVKTMKKDIDAYSMTELRMYDNSQNLDNVPGNDEAILVFRKE